MHNNFDVIRTFINCRCISRGFYMSLVLFVFLFLSLTDAFRLSSWPRFLTKLNEINGLDRGHNLSLSVLMFLIFFLVIFIVELDTFFEKAAASGAKKVKSLSIEERAEFTQKGLFLENEIFEVMVSLSQYLTPLFYHEALY